MKTQTHELLRNQIVWQLTEGRTALSEKFLRNHKATRYVNAHTALVDDIIAAVCQALIPSQKDTLALLAVGGYGRRELFPYSDIDLLILVPAHMDEAQRAHIEQLLQLLWDCGLKTSPAVRTAEECVQMALQDHTVRATLLDRRLIWGCVGCSEQLDALLAADVQGYQLHHFVEAKHRERIERHQRYGDSRFYLEPNVKEGKGGLRDLHHLYWLAREVYGARQLGDMVTRGLWTASDAAMFRRAQVFLWRVRMYLHLLSGRAQERLGFDMQPPLAAAFGYDAALGQSANVPVERFMKRYFRVTKAVADLTRLLASMLEADTLSYPAVGLPRLEARLAHQPHYVLVGAQLAFAPDAQPEEVPHLALEIFWLSQLHCVAIHPQALHRVFRALPTLARVLPHDVQANTLFMNILLHSHHAQETLRELSESGVLSCLIPEFDQIIGQMQYDRYHVFTVDEHTLRAIGILHSIERGDSVDELPLSCGLAARMQSRHVLYIALLCHDIAKGSGQNHAIEGARRVRRIGPQLGLNAAETDMAAWLIEYQMLLSDVALKRDLEEDKTIGDLAAQIQSPERLRLLLLLTVCDMRAVGPNVWNRWRGALLRMAYHKTEAAMLGLRTPALASAQLSRQAWHAAWSAHDHETLREYFSAIDDAIWDSCSPEQTAQVATLAAQFWRQHNAPLMMNWHIDTFEGVTHVLICAQRHPALLAMAAGAVAAMDAAILRARVMALPKQTTLIMLEIQNHRHQAFDDAVRLKKLEQLLIGTVQHGHHERLRPLIAEQRRAHKQQHITTPPHVSFDLHSSHDYTLIEVEGEDRIGFLYVLCAALAELKLTIATAHINTFGRRAADVFYVRNRFGLKVTQPVVLAQIRRQIVQHFRDDATK